MLSHFHPEKLLLFLPSSMAEQHSEVWAQPSLALWWGMQGMGLVLVLNLRHPRGSGTLLHCGNGWHSERASPKW